MRKPRVHRQLQARDGRQYVIREAELADAPQLIAHARTMLAEPQWNVTELNEFQSSIDREESWILSFHERPHNILLVADFGSRVAPHIVSVISFSTQGRNRMRHRGRLGIGVQQPFRGLGIGEAILRTLLDWAAAEPELERVELSVLAHNQRALSLYLKCGFVEEARLSHAYKLTDGTYYDDVMMVKWVKPPENGIDTAR
ncbi:MAG TPA: GNAT family protein [Anaerolineae bacterium]